MKLAFLYAGQGTQHPGMGADLYEKYPAFRQIYDSAALPFDIKELCFTDLENKLNQTRFTQPAMVAFAAGATAVLREKGIRPDCAAGLSLGEYSALHAAGVLDAQTAIELVAFRGKAMEEAAGGRETAMAAVLQLERKELEIACAKASDLGVVELANFNCPGQIVIGGDKAAVEKACELAKSAGARRCIPLKVSGPFHTSLMAPAGQALKNRFQTVDWGNMELPVYFNCTGRPLGIEESIPELLERQVQSSVYLEDTIRNMAADGVDTVVEIGPGRALSAFVRKTVPGITVHAVETVEEMEAVTAALEGRQVWS